MTNITELTDLQLIEYQQAGGTTDLASELASRLEKYIKVEKKADKARRDYISTHLDLMGLKHNHIDVTNIDVLLDDNYRALDVAIAYGQVYRSKHEVVEAYRKHKL